jgi:phage terminase large subunit-like protein
MEAFRQGAKVPVCADDMIGEICHGGLDIGAVSDWTSLQLIFKKDDGVKVLGYYWLPEDTILEAQRRTKMPLIEWAKAGWIRTTAGNVTDFEQVREDINAIADKFKIQMLGCDPHNAVYLATQLVQDGLPMEWFRQGFISMNSPTCELVRLVTSHQLHCGDDPVIAWMMENAQALYDNTGNIKCDRRDRNCKIDGVIALIEAIGVSGLCDETTSIYETRGALLI